MLVEQPQNQLAMSVTDVSTDAAGSGLVCARAGCGAGCDGARGGHVDLGLELCLAPYVRLRVVEVVACWLAAGSLSLTIINLLVSAVLPFAGPYYYRRRFISDLNIGLCSKELVT